jgi:hypothetical protein
VLLAGWLAEAAGRWPPWWWRDGLVSCEADAAFGAMGDTTGLAKAGAAAETLAMLLMALDRSLLLGPHHAAL